MMIQLHKIFIQNKRVPIAYCLSPLLIAITYHHHLSPSSISIIYYCSLLMMAMGDGDGR